MGAGYSGTPLARKLGIKPDQLLVLRHAPAGWRIPDLPSGVRVASAEVADADLVPGFYHRRVRWQPGAGDNSVRSGAAEPTITGVDHGSQPVVRRRQQG